MVAALTMTKYTKPLRIMKYRWIIDFQKEMRYTFPPIPSTRIKCGQYMPLIVLVLENEAYGLLASLAGSYEPLLDSADTGKMRRGYIHVSFAIHYIYLLSFFVQADCPLRT